MVDSLLTKVARVLGDFQKVKQSWYPVENLLVSAFVPQHKLSKECSGALKTCKTEGCILQAWNLLNRNSMSDFFLALSEIFKTPSRNLVSNWFLIALLAVGCRTRFFLLGFLSQTLTIHRTAGEGRGPSFIPFYHFHPLTNIQTFICNFACEMTITYF